MATKIKCSADKIKECVASDKVCNVDTGRCKDPKDALKSTVDDKTLAIDFEKGVVGKKAAVGLIKGFLGNIAQNKLKKKAGVISEVKSKASKGTAIPKPPVQAAGESPDDFLKPDSEKEVSKPAAAVTPVVSKPAFDIKTKTVPEIKKLLKDLGVENYSGKNKDTLIKMYNDAAVKKQVKDAPHARYSVTTGGETGVKTLRFNDQDEIIKYIKSFLMHARWMRERTSPRTLTYNDYAHFTDITVRGSKEDLDAIDKIIGSKDDSKDDSDDENLDEGTKRMFKMIDEDLKKTPVSKPVVVAPVAPVVSKPAFDISNKTVPEIKKILKDLGVVNYSGKNKDALIKMYTDAVATKNIPKETIAAVVKKVETVDLTADRFKGITKDDIRKKLSNDYGVYTTTKESLADVKAKLLAAEAKLAESIKKVAEGCDCDPDSCNIETGECESVDDIERDLHVLTVDNKKFHGTEAALRILAKEMSYAGYRIEKVSGESVVVEAEEEKVKEKIKKRIIEELVGLVTTGREDEDLKPYSESDIKRYLELHNETIDKAVNDMYKELEDYWKEDGGVIDKVEYVANEPGDAFREFLFGRDDGNPPRIDDTEVLGLKYEKDEDISLRSLGASPDESDDVVEGNEIVYKQKPESPVPPPPSEKIVVLPEFTVSELDEKQFKVSPLPVEKKTVPLIHPDADLYDEYIKRENLIEKVKEYKKEIPNLKALADTISGGDKKMFSKEEYELINKIRECVGV
jgi:hypothetical protein